MALTQCRTDTGINRNDSTTKKSLYLGQIPPDLTPKRFAPGVIATDTYLETEVLFSPDMKELSFTRSGGQYKEPIWMVMEYKSGTWSPKSILQSEISEYRERFSPNVSEIKKFDRFKDIPIEGFTKSSRGTYYFYVLNYNDGHGHMSYSRLVDGIYERPKKMSEAINQGKYIAHPFIAPDESYLLWDAEKDNRNTPDIYISFRQKDGSWGKAIKFGEQINTSGYEQRAKVTPDGKYLFFWRGDRKMKEDGSIQWEGNPYWVDAKIIETLRPKQ